MNTYILKRFGLPILIEIIGQEPLKLKDEILNNIFNIVEDILNNTEDFRNNRFCWNVINLEANKSILSKDINIYRIDFNDNEVYSFDSNASKLENLEKLQEDILQLRNRLTESIVDSVLFIEKDICTEFGEKGIIINCDINKKIPYSEFENFLSQKLKYDFSFLKN